MPDRELLELIQTSPEKGLKRLIAEYSGIVYSVIKNRLSSVCSREDIEECVSDTFASFYKSVSGFDPNKGSIKGYLCAIAKHRSSEVYLRCSTKARSVPLDEVFDLSCEGAVDDELVAAEARKRLIAAINRLGEPDREIIVRKYYLEEPSKTVAKRLGLKVSTVDTRAHRALKKLKKELEGIKE